jgi:hypothetical protein
MEFTFETYVSEKTRKKMVYVSAGDGASGAEYPYETASDIATAIQTYIEDYYPDKI